MSLDLMKEQLHAQFTSRVLTFENVKRWKRSERSYIAQMDLNWKYIKAPGPI